MKYNEHKKQFPVCIQAWLSTIRLAEAKPVYVLDCFSNAIDTNALHEPGPCCISKKKCNKNRWQDNTNATMLHKTSGLSCFSFHFRSHPATVVEAGTNQSQQHSNSKQSKPTCVKTKTYMEKKPCPSSLRHHNPWLQQGETWNWPWRVWGKSLNSSE